MVEPAAPVAVTLAVTVGGCTVVPPARGPGMDITMLPPVTPTVGVPEPRFVPPESDTLLTVAFAGTGMRTEMFEMWFTVAVTPDAVWLAGTTIGSVVTTVLKVPPGKTVAGASVWKLRFWVTFVVPPMIGSGPATQLKLRAVAVVSAPAAGAVASAAATTLSRLMPTMRIGVKMDRTRLKLPP